MIVLWYFDVLGNMICYGVVMYGLNFLGNKLVLSYVLKLVLWLISEFIYVKCLVVGEGIGYGEIYVIEVEEWIGIVLIGYVDGWLCYF